MGAKDIVAQIRDKKGGNAASLGGTYIQVPRLATGIFPLDLATGGGFPKGKISIVYGTESSNKTNTLYSAIAYNQYAEEYRDKYWVLVDVENSFDGLWARRMGVDLERLVVTRPDTAEEAIDQVQAFLSAADVNAVFVDSIAALAGNNEVEGAGDRVQVGGNAIFVQTMLKKAVSIQTAANKEAAASAPSLILVNQIRMKIGVMFGNPEKMPGGNYQNFANSLRLRFYGKDVMDNAVSKELPAFKETSVIVKKNKVPIISTKAEFQMRMLGANGASVGTVNDWNTVSKYMKLYELLVKDGNKWIMFGEEFKTLEEARVCVYEEPENERGVKERIIREALISTHGTEVFGDTDDEGESE